MERLRVAILNKTGLTLVEVMIALVIVLLVFLALMQTALVSIDSNMRNILRDEATNIAEQRMNEARNLQFTQTVDNLVSDAGSLSADGCVSADCPTGFSTTGDCVPRNVRSISGFKFCTNRTAVLNSTNTDVNQVTITVGWKWKGEDYTHSISTIVRKR